MLLNPLSSMSFIYFTLLLSLTSASFFNSVTSAKSLTNPSQSLSSSLSSPFIRNHPKYYKRTKHTTSFLFPSKKQLSKIVPFKTWTFDDPCESMEWSQMPNFTMSVVSTSTDSDVTLEESDLVILGVYADDGGEISLEEGEDEEEDDDNVDESNEDEENDENVESTEQAKIAYPLLGGKIKEIDESLNGALTDFMEESASTFKNGTVFGTMTPTFRILQVGSDGTSNKMKRYVLVGLGKTNKKVKPTSFYQLGSKIASRCNVEKAGNVSIVFPPQLAETIANDTSNTTSSNSQGGISTHFSNMVCQFYTTLYSDNRYRTGDNKKILAKKLSSITFMLDSANDDSSSDSDLFGIPGAIKEGKDIARGLYLAKDIVNAPHNVLNSDSLADTAKKIARESQGLIQCNILGKEECEKRGMGAFLGVARGSETDPQFIHLVYKGKGEIKRKVGVIGKGLLFDTGGYNIKKTTMLNMKSDCGGAAAVLGAAHALSEIAPEGVEAHFIVAACENMINEKAMVPSDILTASNGKTIEIINTDAEGRLTLADALVFADQELHCEKIIELSTLTGAVMVSLGADVCGLWTADGKLATELADVSKCTDEQSWRMPLVKGYNSALKSNIADLKNTGARYGGAIVAALFLQNFVNKKIPFAHIDIAGPSFSEKTGGSGFGTKLVLEWVRRQGRD